MGIRTFVSGKVHGVRVTGKSVAYHGSVTLDADLMGKARLEPYQQVTVVNLNNGQRWETYVIAGDVGEFTLNGGGARLGEVGDPCIVLAYEQNAVFEGADVVFVNEHNAVSEVLRYPEERSPEV